MHAARVATLATLGRNGPHVVPITFVLVGDNLYSAVDRKPKTSGRLARLANIERDPRVSLLVDAYDDDWSRLWWCRLDGSARVLDGGAEFSAALEALRAKYDQYERLTPPGPVIAVDVSGWRGWAAS